MAATDSGSGQSSNNTSSVLSSIVSSYRDRSDSFSNPSLVQSMLRNTTETGDIGLFSITPGSLAFTSPSSKPDRAKSRASSTISRYKSPREHMESRLYTHEGNIHSHASLRSSQAADALSMYRADTPYSQYTRASSVQNGSHITLSELRSPSRVDLALLPRPQSPFPYPTRLKRPGYRSSSPSLMEFNGTDTRTYVGLERGPISYPPAVLRHPPGRLRQKRPCIPSHLGHDLAPHDSSSPRSPLAPGSSNLQRFPRTASVRSDNSQDSCVTSITNTTNQQQGKSLKARPSMTYYDYSENFGGSTNRKPIKVHTHHVSMPPRLHHGPITKTSGETPVDAEGATLRRAKTSMEVHLDDTSEYQRASHNKKGTLAEWEQLGISSRLSNKKRLYGRNFGTADRKDSSEYLMGLSTQKYSPGLPVPALDGCNSTDILLDGTQENDLVVTNAESGNENHSESHTQHEKVRRKGIEKSESPAVRKENGLESQDKSNPLPTNTSEGVSSRSPRKENSPDFAKPKFIKVNALANVSIQSPRPERPISFRNPNDRLSRILSIDESFTDENDPMKLYGRHPVRVISPQLKNRSRNLTEDVANVPGSPENKSDTSDAPILDIRGPFRRLRKHFNKAQMPHGAIDDVEKGTKDEENPTEHPIEVAIPTSESGESSRSFERKDGSKKHTKLKSTMPEESDPQAHPHSMDTLQNIDIPTEQHDTVVSHLKDHDDQRDKGEHREAETPRIPAKSRKRDILRLHKSNSNPEWPQLAASVSHASADFVPSVSEARQYSIDRQRTSIADLAPRIHLHPPTPSLGLDDVGSVFSGLDSQTPTNQSEAIVDADVVGNTGSPPAGRAQGNNSRRWTRVSSYFTSNQSTVGSGETQGMTWIQFTSWKFHEQVKECKRAGGKCLGKRKEERDSISFEMR